MSKKRGLSVEEKRSRMMDFFYEKKDFFQLKELEKLCQKEKGITSMSVKEILQSLVDDDMVDTDKIGTSVYFWAFPSKASQNHKRKLDDLTSKIEESQNRKKALQDQVSSAKVGRGEDEKRASVLSELSQAQQRKQHLLSELEKYRECDPEVLDKMRAEISIAKEAANRWTDNIFSVKSWVKKKFAFEESMIDKQFGIPEDFDYID